MLKLEFKLNPKRKIIQKSRFAIAVPLALAFTLALSACGNQGGRQPSPYDPAVQMTSTSSPEEARRLIESQMMTCGGSDCPEGVGLVTWSEKDDVYRCTGSLIAPDVVMTNSHCIPDSLKGGRHDFHGALQFFVQGNSSGDQERIPFARIIKAIPDGPVEGHNIDTDIAFIQLARASRYRPLQIDQNGIAEGEKLRVYSMNSSSLSQRIVMMDESNCIAAQNTVFDPEFAQNVSRTFTATNCKMNHGNSGSPVFGADNKIKGVIEIGFFPEKADEKFMETFRTMRPKGDLMTDFRNMAAGTNLACVDTPVGPVVTPKSECRLNKTAGSQAQSQSQSQQINKLINDVFEVQLDARISEFLKKNGEYQWTMLGKPENEQTELGYYVSRIRAQPHCILGKDGEAPRQVHGRETVWKAYVTLNSAFQPRVDIRVSPGNAFNRTLDACTAANNKPVLKADTETGLAER